MPSVSISRSRFKRTSQHKTSFNLGQLIPIYVDEVLPGDTRSFDLASLVRMSTPIAPIMDNIVLDYYAFFVPNRLVWEHWRDFLGENNASAGIPAVTYTVPTLRSQMAGVVGAGTLLDYFGLSGSTPGSTTLFGMISNNKLSALPLRAYYKIYNHWFRNENVIAPVPINTADVAGAVISYGQYWGDSSKYDEGLVPLKASKLADYFTKSLPYAQKGAPISIPLGTTAPIKASGTLTSLGSSLYFSNGSAPLSGPTALGLASGSGAVSALSSTDSGNYSRAITHTNLVADLSSATAATINQLRYAFQLQKLLEKDSLYGTKYWSILAAHFGVTAPDASIQEPEYLGGKRVHINVDQVLQTTGFDATPSSNSLGTPGANSVTGFKGSLFTKSFVEHGTLMIIAVARQEGRTYGQGINRMFMRNGRYDFYWPVFANLGAQDVKLSEIFATGSSSDKNVFGYQEAWAEYRFRPNLVTGLLNPRRSGSLKYWTLAERFSVNPTLGQTFIEEDRTNLIDALVTGSAGPDFIGDFYFEDIAVRPMPTYSIPGLIDHH